MTLKTTYWFWYGGEIVASVRMQAGTSERAAREEALRQHDRVPLCNRPGELPFEREWKIHSAIVKVYPGGN
jgi:hypothetical protein